MATRVAPRAHDNRDVLCIVLLCALCASLNLHVKSIYRTAPARGESEYTHFMVCARADGLKIYPLGCEI
jgi:hypothetical protein